MTLLRCLIVFSSLACPLFAAASADTIKVGGIDRSFTTLLPPQRPAPLVVVLHGGLQQGRDVARSTNWDRVAEEQRVAVVYPDGINRAWGDLRPAGERIRGGPPAGTDDVSFLSALIEKMTLSGIAEAHRVYLTGVSNGGAMVFTMVCKRADLIAAAAAVIINLTDGLAGSCHPDRPVPMLIMNGTADPLVAYDGGRGTSRFALPKVWSTAATVDFWRKLNGCQLRDGATTTLPHREETHGSTVTIIASLCPPRGDVTLYRINGGGHRVPSLTSAARFPLLSDRLFGSQNHDIDAAAEIWRFFKEH